MHVYEQYFLLLSTPYFFLIPSFDVPFRAHTIICKLLHQHRMLQWCYLNAQLDHAFAVQEQHAAAAISAIWTLVGTCLWCYTLYARNCLENFNFLASVDFFFLLANRAKASGPGILTTTLASCNARASAGRIPCGPGNRVSQHAVVYSMLCDLLYSSCIHQLFFSILLLPFITFHFCVLSLPLAQFSFFSSYNS